MPFVLCKQRVLAVAQPDLQGIDRIRILRYGRRRIHSAQKEARKCAAPGRKICGGGIRLAGGCVAESEVAADSSCVEAVLSRGPKFAANLHRVLATDPRQV